MAELVVIPYAKALFDAALELNKMEEINHDIHFIEEVFKSEAQLIQVLSHPHIKKGEKKSLIQNIFKDNISEYALNFLYILIDKRREKNLSHIIKEFEDLYDHHIGILRVVAVTAIEMEDKSKEKLTETLKRKFNKEIVLTNEVDKSILGGVLLRIDNKLIDTTIISQLRSMESYIQAV